MRRSLLVVIPIILVGVYAWWVLAAPRPPTASVSPVASVVGTRIGDRAPEFRVATVGGPPIVLADFRGKKALLITSLATWCATCIYEAEQLAAAYPAVRDRVELLSVSIDPSDDRLAIEAYRVNLNTPWFYAQATAPGVPELIRAYHLNRFEVTYLVDRDGIIRFSDREITSADALRAAVDALR